MYNRNCPVSILLSIRYSLINSCKKCILSADLFIHLVDHLQLSFWCFFLQFIDLSSVFVWLLNQFHLVAVYWLVVEIEVHLCVTYGLVWLPALEQAISSFSLGSTPLQTRWLFVLLLSCWSLNVTVLVLVCLLVFFNLVQLLND